MAGARRRANGFTIIEVVFALAIFTIGAIAIVRIFVPALAVIQGSGDQTVATHLAENNMTRCNTSTYGPPDYVYDVDSTLISSTNPTGYFDADYAFGGSANHNLSLPKNTIDVSNTALASGPNLTRSQQVEGERQPVYHSSSGSFVFTNFAYQGTVGVSTEDSVDNVKITAGGLLDFRNASLDSSGAAWGDSLAADDDYSPGPGHLSGYTYLVSYSWVTTDGGGNLHTHSVFDEPYVFSASFSDGSPLLGTVMQGRRIAGGLVTSVVSGDVDVKVLHFQNNWGALAAGDETRGIAGIAGAPLAAGTTVYLSYTVADWRWMMYDGAPSSPDPTSSGTAVALSLSLPVRFLSDDNFPGVWLYSSVMQAPENYATGEIFSDSYDGTNFGPSDSAVQLADSPTAPFAKTSGRLVYQFNTALSNTPTAPRVRLAYRTQQAWAQQISVAGAAYVPWIDDGDFSSPAGRPANAPRQPWHEYFWNPDQSNAARTHLIYFHPSEAGKTVDVTFTISGSLTTSSENLVIGNDIQTVSSSGDGVPNAFSDTADPQGGPTLQRAVVLQIEDSGTIGAINGIAGASVQTRTAYLDGGRYRQAVSDDYRKDS